MHDEFIFENNWIFDEHMEQLVVDKWNHEIIEAARDVIGMPLKTEIKTIKPGERFKPKEKKDQELFELFAEVAGFNV
jgi:hypothetical protein